MEATSGDRHVDAFNAAIYQALGDHASPYECSSADSLDASRVLLHAAASSATAEPTVPVFSLTRSPLACKASQNVVDVHMARQGEECECSRRVRPTGVERGVVVVRCECSMCSMKTQNENARHGGRPMRSRETERQRVRVSSAWRT